MEVSLIQDKGHLQNLLVYVVRCIKIEEAPVIVSQEEEASSREKVAGDGR